MIAFYLYSAAFICGMNAVTTNQLDALHCIRCLALHSLPCIAFVALHCIRCLAESFFSLRQVCERNASNAIGYSS
jgi:hypothetical protein